MSLQTQLHDLLARIAAGLRVFPGATELYLFGSLATSEADAYADIDLQLVTADLALPHTHWPYVLDSIQQIEFAWPITSTPETSAFTVLFHGASYYHKLDISVRAAGDGVPIAFTVAPTVCLWAQEARRLSLPPPNSRAYSPAYGTIGHHCIEELIAGVRYVKARKRDQQVTCWRFMRNQPETLLHLLHAQLQGWQPQVTALSTWDYKHLDRYGDGAMQEQIMCHLDWSTPPVMDQNFYWFLEQTVRLYYQQAGAYGACLPEQHIASVLGVRQRFVI